MVKGLVVGILLGILLIACGGYLYFSTGRAPAAVTDPPMPFEKKLAKMALSAHIAKEKIPESPVAADEKSYLSGAEVYKQHCAVCHGLPDQPKTAIAQGMYPPPPQLFEQLVTSDPEGITFWKVTNGIRMTGMPAFQHTLSDTERWQVTMLLAHADRLPAQILSSLTP